MNSQFASFFVGPFQDSAAADELNRFLNAHRVVQIERRPLEGDKGPGWMFLVEYLNVSTKETSSGGPKIDYKEVLSEKDYILFNKLRDLRKILAEKAGNPVYAVFTNEQLSGMAQQKPATLKELLKIPGLGEARAAQYGEAVLALIKAGNEAAEPSF